MFVPTRHGDVQGFLRRRLDPKLERNGPIISTYVIARLCFSLHRLVAPSAILELPSTDDIPERLWGVSPIDFKERSPSLDNGGEAFQSYPGRLEPKTHHGERELWNADSRSRVP